MWINKSAISGDLLNLETKYADKSGLTEGYRFLYNDPVKDGRGWLDKYYLYQIPTNEIALNLELIQNPGY